MMHHRLLAVVVVHWIFALIVLAGFVFFLVTAWRYMRAHETIARAMAERKNDATGGKPEA
jgi:cytochrome bd-type quinol oxidase subunit 1